MTRRTKRDILLIIFTVILLIILTNFALFISFFIKFFNLIFPIITGLILAMILNTPMRGFEKLIEKMFSKTKLKLSLKLRYLFSLLLSIISIVLVLVLVFTMAIPKIIISLKQLVSIIDDKIPEFIILLEKYGFDTTYITESLSDLDENEIIKRITEGVLSIFSTAVDATKTAFGFFSNLIFSFVIAIYLLLDKNNISRQTKKLIYAFIPQTAADSIYKTSYLIRDTFSKFLSGQCLEAVILGLLLFSLFSLFGLPYASLISVMSAVLSFIPYIGSFSACAIGTFLTIISEPKKTVICIVVYLSAQFIEQHFIYPHIVGNSVGLSPFYTVIAVILGGKLFGVLGMILFIPIFSVIFNIVKEVIKDKNLSLNKIKVTVQPKGKNM